MTFAVVLGQPIGRTSADTLKRWLRETGYEPGAISWHTLIRERPASGKVPASVLNAEIARVRAELLDVADLEAVAVVGRYGVAMDTDLWRGGILRANGHSGKMTLEDTPACVCETFPHTEQCPAAKVRSVNAIAITDPYLYVRHVNDGNTRRAIEIEGSCKLILSRLKTMDAPVFLPEVTELERAYVRGYVGLDTETTQDNDLRKRITRGKVDPRASALKMVGLSDGQLSFSGADFADDAEPVAYNMPFDAIITGNWSARWHDPKMGFHLLGEKDTEMKSIALRVLGRPLMHYDEAGGTDREPSYCVADATTHRDLMDEFYRRASPGIRNVYDLIERPMLRLFARWTMQGVFELDRPAAQALYDQQLSEIERLTVRIHALTGIANPDSTDEVAAYVFGWNKAKAPDDKPSVDVKSLSSKLGVRGVPEILERRAMKKQASTYLGAWLAWPFDLLGCMWRGTGAWTGRPSVAALQLHNVPPALRKYLKARDGKRLRSFDNSQLEIRVAAHISRDSKMIKLLRGELPGYEDADVHRWATDLISKALRRPVPRTFGKIGNFSQLYGGSEAAIYTQAPRFGATMDEVRPVARVIADTIKAEYSEFHQWARKVSRLPRVPGLFGAVLIPPPHPDESYLERERVNAPIQRGAVDIVKLQTLALELAGFRTVHQIHDEVIVELDEADDTPDTIETIKRVMAEAVELDVPLKVDSKLWGHHG